MKSPAESIRKRGGAKTRTVNWTNTLVGHANQIIAARLAASKREKKYRSNSSALALIIALALANSISHHDQKSLFAKRCETPPPSCWRSSRRLREQGSGCKAFNEFLIYRHKYRSDSEKFLGRFGQVRAESAAVGPERAAPENRAMKETMKATFMHSR